MRADQSQLSNEHAAKYAVLTGDIVASSKLSPARLKEVMQRLRDGADRFVKKFPGSVYGKLDVYSGDGWQLLMSEHGQSIRAAIFLRAIVKSYGHAKVDTRIAVAWGSVNETSLNPNRISESTGDAFTNSGRALESMKENRRLIWEPVHADGNAGFLKSAVRLLDELAARWTPRQAEIISWALLGLSQEQIGGKVRISQPTVHQALRGAGWSAIEGFLNELNYSLQRL